MSSVDGVTGVGRVSASVGSAAATAISGLRAASLRLDVAANNLANLDTDGFVPARVLGSELPQGGVRSTIATDQRQRGGQSADGSSGGGASDGSTANENSQAPAATLPPAAPLADAPAGSSVNPVAEIVNVLLAKAAFLASLRGLQRDTEMSKHLMEMLG